MDYQKAATGASLVVAQKAPDKWVDFHHALLAYFRTQFQASNGTVVQNLDASWKQIKQIAAGVGVPEDVIATFPLNAAESYLQSATNAWGSANYSGRGETLGTPELIKDHSSVIRLPAEASQWRQTVAGAFGITDSASQGITDTPAPEATEPSQNGTDDAQSSETTDSSN